VFGHGIVLRGDYSSTRMGSSQAVQRNVATGVNSGASDPRKDGAAVPEWHRGGGRPSFLVVRYVERLACRPPTRRRSPFASSCRSHA